jgi:hypothetical protein
MRLMLPALALVLHACHSPPPSETMELRTYDIPKGSATSLLYTFKDVMWMGDKNQMVGRAVLTPDGRLAVLATPGVQSGVEALVEEVKKHPPPAADQTVTLHYFLVLGKPAPSATPYPAGSGEIKEALDEIVRSQGPQTFTVAERAGLSSLHSDEGRLDNVEAKLEIRQTAVQTNDTTYAKLSVRWKDDKVETRVHLAPDRVVILGVTGQHPGDGGENSTLYYVVRVAPRADGKSP